MTLPGRGGGGADIVDDGVGQIKGERTPLFERLTEPRMGGIPRGVEGPGKKHAVAGVQLVGLLDGKGGS